jgi:hypothetical protein
MVMFSCFGCRSRGKLPLLLGQQRRRSTSGVVGAIERECGGEMSEQRGAVVVCMLIFGEGWDWDMES